ncbi:hypothetical protein AB0L64_06120 [Kribbella sp. NPDC051936]
MADQRAAESALAELYASLRSSLTYQHTEQIVEVEVDPMGTLW